MTIQSHLAVGPWNDLCPEVCAFIEDMILVLGNESPPDIGILSGYPIGTGSHDIVREDVVISECRDNRDNQVVRWIIVTKVVGLAENREHLFGDPAIQFEDLDFRSRNVCIVVVSRRVTGPDYKVDLL